MILRWFGLEWPVKCPESTVIRPEYSEGPLWVHPVWSDPAEEGRRTRIITRCPRVTTERPEHTGDMYLLKSPETGQGSVVCGSCTSSGTRYCTAAHDPSNMKKRGWSSKRTRPRFCYKGFTTTMQRNTQGGKKRTEA